MSNTRRVLVAGAAQVGKTTLVRKEMGEAVKKYKPTNKLEYGKEETRLQEYLKYVDIGGARTARFFPREAAKADGFLLMYKDTASLAELAKIHQLVLKHGSASAQRVGVIAHVYSGIDAQQSVQASGQEAAADWGYGFVSVSLEDEKAHEKVFSTMVTQLKPSPTHAGEQPVEDNTAKAAPPQLSRSDVLKARECKAARSSTLSEGIPPVTPAGPTLADMQLMFAKMAEMQKSLMSTQAKVLDLQADLLAQRSHTEIQVEALKERTQTLETSLAAEKEARKTEVSDLQRALKEEKAVRAQLAAELISERSKASVQVVPATGKENSPRSENSSFTSTSSASSILNLPVKTSPRRRKSQRMLHLQHLFEQRFN